jgi:hypothetical protein
MDQVSIVSSLSIFPTAMQVKPVLELARFGVSDSNTLYI